MRCTWGTLLLHSCEIWDYYSDEVEDMDVTVCDAVSLGHLFRKFCRNVLAWSSRFKQFFGVFEKSIWLAYIAEAATLKSSSVPLVNKKAIFGMHKTSLLIPWLHMKERKFVVIFDKSNCSCRAKERMVGLKAPKTFKTSV